MSDNAFPEMITSLPEADIPFKGVRGWISQALDHQIVFMDIEPIGDVAPHSHGEQWGIVVEGEMELTIGSLEIIIISPKEWCTVPNS
jgi:quercetin dioxygenase-like cupin family protein